MCVRVLTGTTVKKKKAKTVVKKDVSLSHITIFFYLD